MKPGNRKAIFILSMGITIASLFAFAGKHHFNQYTWRNGCQQHTCSETQPEKKCTKHGAARNIHQMGIRIVSNHML